MLNKIKALIDKTEKACIIIVPIAYVLIDVLSNFIPALNNLTDERGYLIVLSSLLVLIFIHFEKKDSEIIKFERSDRIVRDLENILEEKPHYNEVNILAVTGYQYFKAFEETHAHVKKLNLLLRKADNKETIDLPSNTNSKDEFMASSIKMQNEWKKLKEAGQIEELNIDFYDFDTTIHFMILDNRNLFWGLLYPKVDYPGTNVLAQYIVNDKSEIGEKMISDFINKWKLIKRFSSRRYQINEDV